jgi:hypothetical protein
MSGRLLRGIAVFSLMGMMGWMPALAQETSDPSTSSPEHKAEKKSIFY